MMTRSLWSRIVIAQVAVALALAFGLPIIVQKTINTVGDDLTEHFMSGEADQVMAMLDNPQAGEAMGGMHGGAVAVYLVAGGYVRRLAGPQIADIADLTPAQLARPLFLHGRFSDFLTRPLKAGQTLVVAEDRRHPAVLRDDISAQFLSRFGVIVLVALICSTLASLLAVGRAMRPIWQAANDARALDPIRPGKVRLREDLVPTEIVSLVHTANELLDRALSGYERERVFSATVAHELRTALATISLRAELVADGEARNKVVEAVNRANGVVTQMLELHGRDGAPIAGDPRAVSNVAHEVIEDLRAVIASSGHHEVSVRQSASGAALRAPEALVRITLTNIVENALRHTPPDATITIICDDAAATVTVADSGPGIRMRSGSDGRRVFSRADGGQTHGAWRRVARPCRPVRCCGGGCRHLRGAGQHDLGRCDRGDFADGASAAGPAGLSGPYGGRHDLHRRAGRNELSRGGDRGPACERRSAHRRGRAGAMQRRGEPRSARLHQERRGPVRRDPQRPAAARASPCRGRARADHP